MIDVLPTDGVYLRSYLAPFAPWLGRDDVTEILVNQPGEVWIEVAGRPVMERVAAPRIDDQLLARLAAQVARHSHQGINRQSPLLAARLPGGERIQMVGPPATRAGWALAIRRHLMSDMPFEAFQYRPATRTETALASDPMDRLRRSVQARKTILISGGTSSGKTTFLNSLLKLVPSHERLILVEDTPEIVAPHANLLGLVAVKGDSGEARVEVDDLVQTALRLRPDRLILGEIRGKEAASFLRAINTGHSGSFTTVHANSPDGAFEQLALMTLQAGSRLGRMEIIAYCRSVVDVVVQLSKQGGERFVSDIQFQSQ